MAEHSSLTGIILQLNTMLVRENGWQGTKMEGHTECNGARAPGTCWLVVYPHFFLTKGPLSMTIGFRGGDLTPAGGSEGWAWRGQKEGWQSALENVVVSTYHRQTDQIKDAATGVCGLLSKTQVGRNRGKAKERGRDQTRQSSDQEITVGNIS